MTNILKCKSYDKCWSIKNNINNFLWLNSDWYFVFKYGICKEVMYSIYKVKK